MKHAAGQYETFNTLYAAMSDTNTVAPNVRLNTRQCSLQDMRDLLAMLASDDYANTPTMEINRNTGAYKLALTRKLIAVNGTKWRNGAPYRRHKLTTLGAKYLAWLDRIDPPVGVYRDDLRQYERRPRSWARWCAALANGEYFVTSHPQTESAPDRLSDDPNTPAPPVGPGPCPF